MVPTNFVQDSNNQLPLLTTTQKHTTCPPDWRINHRHWCIARRLLDRRNSFYRPVSSTSRRVVCGAHRRTAHSICPCGTLVLCLVKCRRTNRIKCAAHMFYVLKQFLSLISDSPTLRSVRTLRSCSNLTFSRGLSPVLLKRAAWTLWSDVQVSTLEHADKRDG